jgi:hypothetical protein
MIILRHFLFPYPLVQMITSQHTRKNHHIRLIQDALQPLHKLEQKRGYRVILEQYPQIMQSDLEAAWDYYAHNKGEIERDIFENEEIDNLSDEEFDKLLKVSCSYG